MEMQAVEACKPARLNRPSESENCPLDLRAKANDDLHDLHKLMAVQHARVCTWIETCLETCQLDLALEL
jgi:hypothetical protein